MSRCPLEQHLHGQVAAEVGVAPLEHGPHAAPGDLAEELKTVRPLRHLDGRRVDQGRGPLPRRRVAEQDARHGSEGRGDRVEHAAAQLAADLVVAEVADGLAAGQAVRRGVCGGPGDGFRVLDRPEESVELEVPGEGLDHLGEAAGVLGRVGALAPLAAEQDLAEDQLDDHVGMVAGRGVDVEVRLGRHAPAGAPASGLVGLEAIDQLGGGQVAPTRQVGPQVGQRVVGLRPRSLVAHRYASRVQRAGLVGWSPPHMDKIDK